MLSIDTDKLRLLQASYSPARFDRDGLCSDEYCLGADDKYRIVYGPFNLSAKPDARVLIVGLTPGYHQLEEAAKAHHEYQQACAKDPQAAVDLIQRRAAFAGSMRANLCNMLDEIGLHQSLRIASCSLMFSERSDLLASTSALQFPVFTKAGMNFSGAANLADVPAFRWMIEELLSSRVREAPNAVVIPLGKSVQSAIEYLVRRGTLDRERYLAGLPHPSGANGHRARLFKESKADLAAQIKSLFGA